MLISRLLDKKSPSKSDDNGLEKRVKFPRLLNAIFDVIMRIDEGLIKIGISLPVGGTLLVIARKSEKQVASC
jgi:hypothetical protein